MRRGIVFVGIGILDFELYLCFFGDEKIDTVQSYMIHSNYFTTGQWIPGQEKGVSYFHAE